MEQADWQDIANELSDGLREVRTALDSYQAALNKAYDHRKLLGDDKEYLEIWRIILDFTSSAPTGFSAKLRSTWSLSSLRLRMGEMEILIFGVSGLNRWLSGITLPLAS